MKRIGWLIGLGALVYFLSQQEVGAAGAPPGGEEPPGMGPQPPSARRTLRMGMRGEDVKALQRALIAARFPVTVDGVYGKLLQVAVARFQAAKGLRADGIVGAQTRAALGI